MTGLSGTLWLDVTSCALVLLGAFLSFAAGVGLLRFGDLMGRLHSQAKPQSLGLLLMLLAMALQQTEVGIVLFLLPVALFQFITTPAAGMVLARGGYRSRHYEHVPLFVDELEDEVDRAQRAEEAAAIREQRPILPDASDEPEPHEPNPNAPTL
ncbi:cation:proton antiporter [Gulosibacter bifidus]|uniref:Cation:proton antiporter n=1 Tax=Gulosibacter bifidus TaxID=272239 RepID=A0ABW5RIY1_9MICO|nr:monovalent cation/H(+) antiporter subunit G [Gulosibacter bifidus]